MSQSLINQSHLIHNVDKLVRDILSNAISFDTIIKTLNGFYEPFMDNLDADLFYSKTIDAFVYSTNAIVGDLYPSDVIWDHDRTQRFISTLSCYRNDIELEDNAWYYQECMNRDNLNIYIRNLINHYSRLLFVRIDLMYLIETSHLVTIYTFNDHMNKLREFIGNKRTCFAHLQGNAWALEQGYQNGGLHCHLLLIYDGSERQDDWYLAEEVAKRWYEITGGIGTYYNYHYAESKQKYQINNRLGIGMIHRDNPQQVENAVCTALYLAKPDKKGQHLRVWLPSMRTFGHGIYRTNKRRGLPAIAN